MKILLSRKECEIITNDDQPSFGGNTNQMPRSQHLFGKLHYKSI